MIASAKRFAMRSGDCRGCGAFPPTRRKRRRASAPAVEVEQLPPRSGNFSFEGPFGTYDRAALQRGFQVYKDVCSACHSLEYIAFRNLAEEGGPGLTPSPGQRACVCVSRSRRSERAGPDGRRQRTDFDASGRGLRSPSAAVSQRAGGARLQQRRSAAGSLAHRQGARRRRRLRLFDPDRLRTAAARRRHRGDGPLLQSLFPRRSDFDAAAAQSRTR